MIGLSKSFTPRGTFSAVRPALPVPILFAFASNPPHLRNLRNPITPQDTVRTIFIIQNAEQRGTMLFVYRRAGLSD